jgi:hypothetical protein
MVRRDPARRSAAARAHPPPASPAPARAQVVSLHCNLDANTKHLINKQRLALMKKDAVLVNAARGPCIDEAALVEHLKANPEVRGGGGAAAAGPVAPGVLPAARRSAARSALALLQRPQAGRAASAARGQGCWGSCLRCSLLDH